MKHIMEAMNVFGDGEEDEGTFNPEEFFSFGTPSAPKAEIKPDPYANPFAQETLSKVSEEIEVTDVEGAQDINIGNTLPLTEPPKVEVMPVQELEPRTISTNNRFNSFESTSEPASVTQEITIMSDPNDVDIFRNISSEQTPVEATMPTPVETPMIEVEPEGEVDLSIDLDIDMEEYEEDPELAELEKIAVRKDSEEVARTLGGELGNRQVLTEDITFNIDEETAPDTYQYAVNQNEIHGNSTEVAPPAYAEPQIETPQYVAPQQQVQQQLNGNSPLTGINIYGSPFGPKFRDVAVAEAKEVMVDLAKFKDGSKIIGDVYVESAKVLTYQVDKKRIEYDFRTANGGRIKGSQFSIPNYMTNDNAKELIGKVLKLEGKWNLYNRAKNIVVDSVTDTTDTTVEDFLGKVGFDTYKEWYTHLYNKIQTPWVRELVDDILIKEGTADKMMTNPASLSNHDNGKGGLFIHTMKITLIAYQSALLYPSVNTDVVIASCLLHDIGKINEIGVGTYTDIGVTTGHIVIGHMLVRDKLNQMKNRGVELDDNIGMNILHCILAHHGKLEYGSPVTPKTREAWIVHVSDMMDTMVTHIDEQLGTNEQRTYSKMMRHDVLDLNR